MEKAPEKRSPPSPPWKPGQSGNPSGRRPGTGKVAKLRESIAQHIPAIVDKLVEQAKDGDAQAARLLIERVIPAVKAAELPAPLALPEGSVVEQARAVIAGAGAGLLAPGQAAQLLGALASLARLVESEELAARVAALEARDGNKP